VQFFVYFPKFMPMHAMSLNLWIRYHDIPQNGMQCMFMPRRALTHIYANEMYVYG